MPETSPGGARPGRVRPGERPGRKAPPTPFLPLLIVCQVQGRSSQVRRPRPGPSVRAGDREPRAFLAWPRCPAWASGIPAAAPIPEGTKGAPRPCWRPPTLGVAARAPPRLHGRGWRGTIPKSTWVRGVALRLLAPHLPVARDRGGGARPCPPGPFDPAQTLLRTSARPGAATTSGKPSSTAPASATAAPGPRAPPPGPGALNRCRAPRGHSGRARGGGSSCAVIRPGTKARPPVLGQVNTRFVMEMSAGQPEQMIRGLGKRRPRPGAGEGSGAGGGDQSSAPGPPAEHATRPFSCKSAHAFATCCRPAASTRRPAPAEPGRPPCAAPRQPNQTPANHVGLGQSLLSAPRRTAALKRKVIRHAVTLPHREGHRPTPGGSSGRPALRKESFRRHCQGHGFLLSPSSTPPHGNLGRVVAVLAGGGASSPLGGCGQGGQKRPPDGASRGWRCAQSPATGKPPVSKRKPALPRPPFSLLGADGGLGQSVSSTREIHTWLPQV